MLDQFVACRDAAGPALAIVVEAQLIHRRRIDAAEANAAVADHELIAFADFRHAGDLGRLCDRRRKQEQNGHQPEQNDGKQHS